MKNYIWEPLGITTMTFHLGKRPGMKEGMPKARMRQGGTHLLFLTVRDPNGKLERGISPYFDVNEIYEDYEGYLGYFGSVVDFHKVLRSITSGEGTLLEQEMSDELFKP
jgi:hypothetical protein